MGLSLGEYSALCFAGAISFEDGVRLTYTRGKAMQDASNIIPSGMVSVVGLELSVVEMYCTLAKQQTNQDIAIGNYLAPKNYSVSGSLESLNTFQFLLSTRHQPALSSSPPPSPSSVRITPLAVSGAFHSSYMLRAIPFMEDIIQNTTIKMPRIPVISNYTATVYDSVESIRTGLVKQISEPVQWEKTMAQVILSTRLNSSHKTLHPHSSNNSSNSNSSDDEGFERAVEIGPGRVCAGIVKSFNRRAEVTQVGVE
jgi:[acyl-carrier-protein] S-malonyltransferase